MLGHLFSPFRFSPFLWWPEQLLLSRSHTDYKFIANSAASVDSIDDVAEFTATKNAMEVLGFSADEQASLFRTTAAILHFGNIEAAAKSRNDEQAEIHNKSSEFGCLAFMGIVDLQAFADRVRLILC